MDMVSAYLVDVLFINIVIQIVLPGCCPCFALLGDEVPEEYLPVLVGGS
jgi:hypothetical protein